MELHSASQFDETLRRGNLIFRIAAQRVLLLEAMPRELELTPIEFRLLLHFARHPGEVLTRTQIIGVIWGDRVHVLDRTIDTHISNLRRKVQGSGYEFRAVYGVGYTFAEQSAAEKKAVAL